MCQKYIIYCTNNPIQYLSLFHKARDCSFYQYTTIITHLACWENTPPPPKKSCLWLVLANFSNALPTSCVGYYAFKPIESVVNCLMIPSLIDKTKQRTRSKQKQMSQVKETNIVQVEKIIYSGYTEHYCLYIKTAVLNSLVNKKTINHWYTDLKYI